ncbi:hypothetical protein [Streptomyces nondiastaticus]|uniref:Uncharacterized protein n=2 Tax=Streptomyces TaxID=1883 RepID=A0ABW6TUW8_9ACTN
MTLPNDWDWDSLTTLSVPARRLPEYLMALVGEEAEARHRARGVLYCEVANQGHL